MSKANQKKPVPAEAPLIQKIEPPVEKRVKIASEMFDQLRKEQEAWSVCQTIAEDFIDLTYAAVSSKAINEMVPMYCVNQSIVSSSMSALFQMKNSDKRVDDWIMTKAQVMDDCEEPVPASCETSEYLDK